MRECSHGAFEAGRRWKLQVERLLWKGSVFILSGDEVVEEYVMDGGEDGV